MITTEILTPKEKARQERNVRICNRYRQLAKALPQCSNNRLIDKIASEVSMTSMSVRNILKRNGLRTGKR